MRTRTSDIPLFTRYAVGLAAVFLLAATPTLGGKCVKFFGMEHCPLGFSQLRLSEEGLAVTSGDEQGAAVRIETAGAASWDAWLTPIEPKLDQRMVLTFEGARPDGSKELREQVAVTRAPASREGLGGIYVKPSIHGAATYTVRGYREGVQVFEVSRVAPVREEIGGPRAPGDEQWQRLIYFPGPWRSGHGIWGDDGCTPGIDFPWPIPVRFPKGELSAPVDVVTFTPEGARYESKALGAISFEGLGMPSFVIEQEARSP